MDFKAPPITGKLNGFPFCIFYLILYFVSLSKSPDIKSPLSQRDIPPLRSAMNLFRRNQDKLIPTTTLSYTKKRMTFYSHPLIEIRDIGDILLSDVVDDLHEVLRVFPFDVVGLQKSGKVLLVDTFKRVYVLLACLDKFIADHKEGLLCHRKFL